MTDSLQPSIISLTTQYRNDPTLLFQQLCAGKTPSLLLESADISSKTNINSLLFIDNALRITCYGTQVIIQALTTNGASLLPAIAQLIDKNVRQEFTLTSLILDYPALDFNQQCDENERLQQQSVFDSLRAILKLLTTTEDEASHIMLAGLFAYDLIEQFEPIPVLPRSNKCPDFCFYLPELFLHLRHDHQSASLHSIAYTADATVQRRLYTRLEQVISQIKQPPTPIAKPSLPPNNELNCDISDHDYGQIVQELQNNIRAGDVFQVVPSRTFSLPCPNPLAAYQELKLSNPSPYMFYMHDEDFCLFGASPESALKFSAATRQIEIYPIAGTKPRGKNPDGSIDLDLDCRLELELRLNHKEMAEHIMLVDLARNDLAKICLPGSRYVADLTKVDRYSHVMHLISRVVATLRPELDALHGYRASLNMGTLTGAPKVRAMQLIAATEKKRRGSYAGAVGYFDLAGNFDTCIVIRSAYVENNLAYIQVGAGIVLDSDPAAEIQETKQKSQAVIAAISQVNQAKD